VRLNYLIFEDGTCIGKAKDVELNPDFVAQQAKLGIKYVEDLDDVKADDSTISLDPDSKIIVDVQKDADIQKDVVPELFIIVKIILDAIVSGDTGVLKELQAKLDKVISP
jgi:hypothetical protein